MVMASAQGGVRLCPCHSTSFLLSVICLFIGGGTWSYTYLQGGSNTLAGTGLLGSYVIVSSGFIVQL